MAPAQVDAPPLCSKCQNPAFKPRVNVNSSELYMKFRSESGPFALKTQEVDDIILLCDRDLEDYEAEVMRLQAQILFVQGQQTRLRNHKTKILSLNSPIRKLPNEVLALIFDYACEWNVLQEFPWTFDEEAQTKLTLPIITYLPALSLSSTCSRWRSVAKSSPSLWSRLKLEISAKYAEPGVLDAFIAAVDLFLVCSNQNPLEIDLDIRGESEHRSLALDLLMQHSQRWKTFSYNGSYTIATHLDYHSSQNFSRLESLQIHEAPSVAEDLDIFQETPKLRKLLAGNCLVSQIPWTQVTELEFWIFHDQLDRILDTCPNLVLLELWEAREASTISPCIPPKTSKTIDTLRIIVDDSDLPQGLLDVTLSSFTFPALNELHIESNSSRKTYDRKWPKDLFATFLSRSSCKLTTFVIHGVGLTDADLSSALQLLPSLTTLDISDYEALPKINPITSDFISSLHSSSQNKLARSNSIVIPKLCNLELDVSGIDFSSAWFHRAGIHIHSLQRQLKSTVYDQWCCDSVNEK
ncbi:hypothetical protein BT96DRAFT_438501 [Gymnopus androsaceus JB14]|uniref:Uncharacterized protein n=1 Tax=Gymnopus androsaceus JB14 TaxID=1447944 RepID=A0A6A4I4L6_9AGAR|nr:hypothetical protein BT96DRAFT_438501 [Gymnopus androsaceus JB14]